MNKKHSEAVKLRLTGRSYNEIQNIIGISKSTLSAWLRKVVLSDVAQKRLAERSKLGTAQLIKRNKMQTHWARKKMLQIHKEASAEFPRVSSKDLLLLGTALYWAEGYKRLKKYGGIERTGHAISFVNADEEMIRIFIRFLKEILGVSADVITATMRLYPHINESVALTHWMRVTKLPIESFRKTTNLISISSRRKKAFNTLPFGTLQVVAARTEKFHRLMGWVEEMKKRF